MLAIFITLQMKDLMNDIASVIPLLSGKMLALSLGNDQSMQ